MINEIRRFAYYIKKAVKNYKKEKTNPHLSYQEFKRNRQIKKFKDPRRVEIYSKVTLSHEQEAEIDELFITNYGQKIPYTWHKHYTAFTGYFDVNYFPELIYIPEFEYYMNQEKSFIDVMEDKNFLPLIANGIGIKTAKNIISCTQGLYRDCNNHIINKTDAIRQLSDIGKVFIKPSIDTSSGQGCFVADLKNGKAQGLDKSIEDIISGLGQNFCVQEIIVCEDSIRKIYDKSANTFRVITYRWIDEILSMPVILRIGQGGATVDNAHAGGMFIAVSDDGKLHETAFTEFKKEFKQHPDTHFVFKDYVIPNTDKVITAAKTLHANVPRLGVINWDFTIDNDGNPVLIEANVMLGGIWVIQMAHGKGPFGERTAEVLQWLKLMNSLPQSEYKNHMFGKM